MENIGRHYMWPFHFEAFWLMHPNFNNMINVVWKSSNPWMAQKFINSNKNSKI